jgi:transcriptional regulator GlxA family with amidase domain
MVMPRAIRVLGYSLSAVVSVALVGFVGLMRGSGSIMAPPSAAQVACVVPAPAPAHDPSKPTVAVLLGDTRTEGTDFLAPYAMFVESRAYNVYAVADSRAVRTLAGGVDVVPQLSFDELDARLHGSPDIVVVPAISHIDAPANAGALDWLRRRGTDAVLFSWCAGAEVLAASGLIDGETVTTHWNRVDEFERAYPAIHWTRGLRYVDSGRVLTTGGITSGIDATLHLLKVRDGQAVAERVAASFAYPWSSYVDRPELPQYTAEPVDNAVYAHLAFGWPKTDTGVWLYDGVGEVELTAVIDGYGLTAVEETTTVADVTSVTSEHGLQIVPRRHVADASAMHRVVVPGGRAAAEAGERVSMVIPRDRLSVLAHDERPASAYTLALEDLAARHDVAIATYAARHLEVRTPLHLVGPVLAPRLAVVPVLAALAGAGALWVLLRLVRRFRRVPPGRATDRIGPEVSTSLPMRSPAR